MSSNHVGGVLSGVNPFDYNSSSPITLFLFQTCLILIMCNLVHIPFSKIRQPRVISEVIAGVILGPTVFGQIPNYTKTVFPSASIPGLNLVANLGIILFMFFLGLEVDIEFIKKHLKTALSIGLITLAVPFGFGCLLAIPLFNTYANKDPDDRYVKFTVYMVFIAVSMSVTAFPVLCRILNELRLIKDRAGIVVLGAGIINDILGWVLLALSVILSNSESSPVNTVYILLCTLGWFLIYFFPLKYLLKWILIKTHELDRPKPSPLATMLILLIMFVSAYFTDIIGVHPIFGAFIAGLVVPRENNYVVKLAERMEDIPNIVFIPIYFAVSGLSVDLTLLNKGEDWGYIFAAIGIAVGSKLVSGSVTAYLHGLFFRESLAVGVLMSCKGIVEIVVLTIGLNAGIITQKIYGMFILMALVSTFITTPMTQMIYTDSYRKTIKPRMIQKRNKKRHQENPDLELNFNSSHNRNSNDEEIYMDEITPLTQDDKEELEFIRRKKSLFCFEDITTFIPTRIINIINSTDTISPSLHLLNYLIFAKNSSIQSKLNYHNINSNNSLPNHHGGKTTSTSISRISSGSTLKVKSLKLKHFFSKNNDVYENLSVVDENVQNFDAMIPLKAIHLKLLTERTTDLLQSSKFYHDETYATDVDSHNRNTYVNSDSYLEIFDIFTRLGKIPFSSEVIFSTMREKAINIVNTEMNDSDIVILPLKGSSFNTTQSIITSNGNPSSHRNISWDLNNFEQCCSHMFGLNELSSNFFQNLSKSLKANFIMMISNTGGRICVDRFKKKRYNLLLPNPNLASSDFFAMYLFLYVCYKSILAGDPIRGTIYINGKNIDFLDNLYNLFPDQDWFADASIDIINVDVAEKSIEEISSTSFIEAVLNDNTPEITLDDIEDTTFIIPEHLFSGTVPFSEEVKSTILQGARRKFDVLIPHYYCSERPNSNGPTDPTMVSSQNIKIDDKSELCTSKAYASSTFTTQTNKID
ncbi:hypothetical protein TBLA_0C02920 [Henningerozyma blattae CBS 6284]|uniref:Cation/H+ exchanger transmembrane domain-containing protein n=1 Tax=Henningerozyma blattae (strain ATCC 34711 / CBS 6284 / DSM 70876 / NBRC 10599 / NRRL Y-10934 / UCD 77-7) TaxID=1071380 RepID=I2H145_HENB6|nr:hypothetical protein TBLA_0C02920 [Tetrapisispora blattae CBS 6284]CCH60097.1 hypothetical protein TBLA_0C02920 [Tetrapisispora blattae CBS 6284]